MSDLADTSLMAPAAPTSSSAPASVDPLPSAPLMPLHRLPVALRLLIGSLAGLVAIVAVGVVSVVVISRQRSAMDNLALVSHAQRVLQDADMEHTAIMADVLAIDNTWTGRAPDDLRGKLARDIDTYRRFLVTAESMPLTDDLRTAIVQIEPQLDAYLTRATAFARRPLEQQRLRSDEGQAFQEAFDRLSSTNQQLTDLFANRVATADARADAAARSAIWAILLSCLVAVAIVASAGRIVARSIAGSLGRVRSAAEAISAGDLSVRTTVHVQDDIGILATAVNRMADTLQSMIARLQTDQEQDAFSRQLSEVLDMSDSESDTHAVIARGMSAAARDMPMELLVADSSRAHMERAAIHPSQGAPGCGVESPYACMAVRRGNPMVFENSEALNACHYLHERACGPVSAVCVPLSFMGRALGVLHASAPAGAAPPPPVINRLTTLGILAGNRIGTVRAFQRTQIQASTDGLTGLANRRTLEAKVRSLSAGTGYAFVLADLDHFKRLNDKHGHDAGDHALRVFADVLRQSLRSADQAARWGGEEFAILLEGHDAHMAFEVVERIRERMAIGLQGGPAVTASFGISDTSMAATFEHLVRIADDALYQSKEAGRNRATIGDRLRVMDRVPRRQAEHLAAVDVDALLEVTGMS